MFEFNRSKRLTCRTLLWMSKRSVNELLAKNTYLLNHVNGVQLVKRTRSNLLKIEKLLDNERSMEGNMQTVFRSNYSSRNVCHI